MTDQNMIIERDVGIKMDDGLVLRADIFRPNNSEKVPAIMNIGPYCKGLSYQEGSAESWKYMSETHPEILDGSTCSFLTWETVDPERWVPENYAVIRVDTRGTGRSPGFMDFYSDRETRDYYQCIEWAGTRDWCSGKVGLLGISYHAITQWLVAAKQPPHLAAIIPWEGAADHFRDTTHHGGILCNGWVEGWFPRRALTGQHGVGSRGPIDHWIGEPCTGPETLSEEELAKNRRDYIADCANHNLDDEFHKERSADFSKILVPLLSCGNWGGIGNHIRGNFEGYLRSASNQKWLNVHVGKYEEYFYLPYGRKLQKRFFDKFLRGQNNGWENEPRVLLMIRHPDRFVDRKENEWPIARTKWTKMHLNTSEMKLSTEPLTKAGKAGFKAMESQSVFTSPPFQEETEITGPLAAKLFVSSSTPDADLFLTLQGFSPEGKEITFQGANEPKVPLAQGWLRASHRKLDPKLSTPYRPYHSHDEIQPLDPGKIYELDVELLPTSIVLPKGYRITLMVAGRDFEREGASGRFKGSGPFYHNNPSDRKKGLFDGFTELHSGSEHDSYLLLPVVPPKL